MPTGFTNFDRALLYRILAGQEEALGTMQALSDKLDAISTQETTIMSAMDDLEGKMGTLESKEQGQEMLLDAIHQELVDMATTGATAARVQALAARIDAVNSNIDAAVARDADPAAPPVVVPPVATP